MTVPTTGMDETSPAGSQKVNLGDNRIREYKTQNREVMEKDHEYPSSGQSATAGQHKQVTLQEQADLGTGAVSATILGSQTIGGKGECVYTDEDDNDVQLTNAGKLHVPISTFTAKSSLVAADSVLINDSAASEAAKKVLMSTIWDTLLPVGSVYTNATVATNPGTLLGFGTWVAIEGECIVGKATSGTFGSVGSVSEGAETVTLALTEIPAHTHTFRRPDNNVNVSSGTNDTGSKTASDGQSTGSAGGGSAHNNIQPSFVCYVWRRTV